MQMKTSMKASGMKVKETGTEFLQSEMEIILRVIGLMTSEKVKDLIIFRRRISFLLENG